MIFITETAFSTYNSHVLLSIKGLLLEQINFEMKLSDSVSTLMSKNVKTIGANDSLLKVKHFFEARDFHHHLPVVDGDKLVGMVSLYDFLIVKSGATLDDNDPVYSSVIVNDFMRSPVISVSESDTLEKALKLFIDKTIEALPVLTAGKLVGIITSNDILRALLRG
jgi:acetoin utilization protein AcuB